MHQRIAAEKERLENAANGRVRATIADLHQRVDQRQLSDADDLNKTLTSLSLERQFLGEDSDVALEARYAPWVFHSAVAAHHSVADHQAVRTACVLTRFGTRLRYEPSELSSFFACPGGIQFPFFK